MFIRVYYCLVKSMWIRKKIGQHSISLMSGVFNSRSSHTIDSNKMVLDAALLNTQHYKVRIKSKVEQSSEWSCALAFSSLL